MVAKFYIMVTPLTLLLDEVGMGSTRSLRWVD